MRLPNWESAAVLYVSLLILVLLPDCKAQGDEDCGRRTTCGDCMGSAECVWCLDDAQDVGVAPRCFGRDSAGARECKDAQDAESATVLEENLPLNPDAPSDEDIVLISPQRARATVRPGAKREFGHRIDFQVMHGSANLPFIQRVISLPIIQTIRKACFRPRHWP